jgi:NAD(P) transhydrogenase subunit beta
MTGSAPILLAYLTSALFFILGLKQMSHPRTSVRGIVIAALGMLIAIAVTFLDTQVAG